jgi:hypothetical protein
VSADAAGAKLLLGRKDLSHSDRLYMLDAVPQDVLGEPSGVLLLACCCDSAAPSLLAAAGVPLGGGSAGTATAPNALVVVFGGLAGGVVADRSQVSVPAL